MAGLTPLAAVAVFLCLTYAAWRRYVRVTESARGTRADTCPYSLTEVAGDRPFASVPHQEGVQWLHDVFSRSAERFPDHVALQVPHTGESLTFADLERQAEAVAAALSTFVTGPDQVVAVAMAQDNAQIVAAHLGILKAGGVSMFLDTTLPDPLIAHMVADARPVAVLVRGQGDFRGLPTLDVLAIGEATRRRARPSWLDDPARRLATIFYTSGTTGMPKGVESAHAGYVNLALSYADYFDLVPGVDATSLTSSLGYDGSISEMYSAWVSGCTVVLLTKEQVRSGPDLVPVLREAEVTVLFCPPVLLTTLTPAPELDLPYPLCRYVVPAGEAFPAALVEPWTRGRRQIINTYGPTEASTDTSRQSLRCGEPVTIGTPFPNVTYVILEPGTTRPLPHGSAGELCIGGVHVARGYRNLPEQTAQKFITHPRFGRLYRTGDRCRIDVRTLRVHFLGRLDTQVKVRGHRVEVQPVEDALQADFDEIEAAVLDHQNEELVAFVVAPSIAGNGAPAVAPAPAEWSARITGALAGRFPPASVPSRVFLVAAFAMKPVSGKIDRERLPDLSRPLDPDARRASQAPPAPLAGPGDTAGGADRRHRGARGIAPGSEEVLTICRDLLGADLGWDDVFADHGGHSIVIAQLAQRLRAAGWAVPVRALLGDRDTPAKVARCPRQDPLRAQPPGAAAVPDRGRAGPDGAGERALGVRLFTTLQGLFLVALYSPHLLGFLGLLSFAEVGELVLTGGLPQFVLAGFGLYLLALVLPFATLLWVMALKLVLFGRLHDAGVAPGIYPKWGRTHLRTWCIGRLERSVLGPLGTMFVSAPLLAYALRRLGATVGDNLRCAPDVAFSGPLDLLSIENDVAIQTGAYVSVTRWVGEELHVGPVRLESGCKIGMRAGVAGPVTVGSESWVTPLTPVLGDVGPNEIREGAPARFSGRRVGLARTRRHCRLAGPASVMEAANVLVQVLLEFWLVVAPTALVTWLAAISIPVPDTVRAGAYFEVVPMHEVVWQLGVRAFVTTWSSMLLVSVLGCVFIRWTRASPGLYPSRSFTGALLLYRVKMLNRIQRWWTWTITGQYLRALAGLHFSRVGASECDVMHDLVPEAASADARVFWSHGCYTNMLDHEAGHIVLRRLDMPASFFASNNCVLESGQLTDGLLVGVSTPASEIGFRRQMRSRPGEPVTVAGNPPLRFGSREADAGSRADRRPTFPLFLARVSLNDVLGIAMLPIAEVLAYTLLYLSLLRLGAHPVTGALAALLLTELSLIAACVAVKKVLVGSTWGSAHRAPFWSWRHFAYFFAQDCFLAWCRRPLGLLAGTVVSNVVLRWMGCRIGRRSLVVDPLQASDWNAVSFGDDCVVAGFLQLHTLENMTLKVKRTEVGPGTAVNFGATVMGGAVIEPGTTLMPLSMVLKEMELPAAVYEGSPAEAVAGPPRPQAPPGAAALAASQAPGDDRGPR